MKKIMLLSLCLLVLQACTDVVDELGIDQPDVIDVIEGNNSIPFNSYLGQYFFLDNKDHPISSIIEKKISHNFNSPIMSGVDINKIGARWIGDFHFEPNSYLFSIKSNRGIKITIDNKIVLSDTDNKEDKVYQVKQDLNGTHRLLVEYNLIGSGSSTSTSVISVNSDSTGAKSNDPVVEVGGSNTTIELGWLVNNSPSSEDDDVKEDTLVVNDQVGVFSAEEIATWRDRAINGPYRTNNDMGPNSPGDWARITQYKNDFLSKSLEFWSGQFSSEPLQVHHNLLAASFYNLLFPDDNLSKKLKEQILQQVDRFQWSKYNPTSSEFGETGFIHGQWLSRFFNAYRYSEHLFSNSEKEAIKKWFVDAGYFFKENVNAQLKIHLPNRENGDYSVKKGVFTYNPAWDGYVYVNEKGENVYRSTHISKWYNNRRASKLQPAGLIGIHYGDKELIKHAKMFFKEWLMYGVYPDGTLGEYERNHDRNPQQGLVYGIVTQEVLIQWAFELWKKGDKELFEFTTSEGFLDSEGGKKNLKLTLDAYCQQATHLVKRYYKSPEEKYLIDTSSPSGENWVFGVTLAMANLYYNDPLIKQVYMRDHPNLNGYLPHYSGSGPIRWPWSGNGASIPGYLFMYGGLEGQAGF